MTRIGFLACETTLPGKGRRRDDAFEHDLMIGALEPAMARRGMKLEAIDWEAPLTAFEGVAAVLLGTAWNYQDKAQDFLARLEALAARGIAVFNPPETVRWNMVKTYLRDLEAGGVPTIATLWQESVDADDARAAMDAFGCDRLVIKRQIGAGALGQDLLTRGTIPDDWRFDRPAMLQPFIPAIAEEGEISFVMIGGTFSHAVRKLPARGDYRIQSLYGGRERRHEPNTTALRTVHNVLDALPVADPLYARIDMLGPPGELRVMEVELIEPFLYPEQGPQIGARIAQALSERLQTA